MNKIIKKSGKYLESSASQDSDCSRVEKAGSKYSSYDILERHFPRKYKVTSFTVNRITFIQYLISRSVEKKVYTNMMLNIGDVSMHSSHTSDIRKSRYTTTLLIFKRLLYR